MAEDDANVLTHDTSALMLKEASTGVDENEVIIQGLVEKERAATKQTSPTKKQHSHSKNSSRSTEILVEIEKVVQWQARSKYSMKSEYYRWKSTRSKVRDVERRGE
ncbi:hypothetical protein ACFE04_022033 [Oxalis oulophora]